MDHAYQYGHISAAGTTIGAAAVMGAQAIQRLSGAERYQDLRTAVTRLEKVATELRGPARLTAVRRWVSVLTELAASTGGAGGVNAPAVPDDWQQLHLSPFDAVEQPGSEPLVLRVRRFSPYPLPIPPPPITCTSHLPPPWWHCW